MRRSFAFLYAIFGTVLSVLVASSERQAYAQSDAEKCLIPMWSHLKIEGCSRLIKRNPRDALAYQSRADGWIDVGNFDKAFADYSTAIKLDAKMWEAYYGRGEVWRIKANYKEAISDLNGALELESRYGPPDHGFQWSIYLRRGDIWRGMSDYDKAISDYQTALNKFPGSREAKRNLEQALYEQALKAKKTQ